MKVIITDCDHDSIDIEKKVFADAAMEVELKQAITDTSFSLKQTFCRTVLV